MTLSNAADAVRDIWNPIAPPSDLFREKRPGSLRAR
jgi:hypothetical protein